MSVDDVVDQETDDLLFLAVHQGIIATIGRAQKLDREAQDFVSNYTTFYRSPARFPPPDLCREASSHIIEALHRNPYDLHQLQKGLYTASGICCIPATFFTLLSAGVLPALPFAAAAIGFFALRRMAKRHSKQDAAKLMQLIHDHPSVLSTPLAQSRDYTGAVLLSYGSIQREEVM